MNPYPWAVASASGRLAIQPPPAPTPNSDSSATGYRRQHPRGDCGRNRLSRYTQGESSLRPSVAAFSRGRVAARASVRPAARRAADYERPHGLEGRQTRAAPAAQRAAGRERQGRRDAAPPRCRYGASETALASLPPWPTPTNTASVLPASTCRRTASLGSTSYRHEPQARPRRATRSQRPPCLRRPVRPLRLRSGGWGKA